MAEACVLLTLNKAEAETLFDVLYFGVGGSMKNSRRRHTDAIQDALRAAGVDKNGRGDIDTTKRGIYFRDSR